MAKARMYGAKVKPPVNDRFLEHYWNRKLRQKQQGNAMSKQVAAQLRKEKEA